MRKTELVKVSKRYVGVLVPSPAKLRQGACAFKANPSDRRNQLATVKIWVEQRSYVRALPGVCMQCMTSVDFCIRTWYAHTHIHAWHAQHVEQLQGDSMAGLLRSLTA